MIEVTVVPNSKRFSILRKDGKVKIHLKNPAENNKANLELVNELSERLGGAHVQLLSGQTSKRKKLAIDAGEEEFEKLILGAQTKL